MVRSFKNELIRSRSNHLAANFHTLGYINSSKTDRWACLTGFIMGKYETRLHELGLYWAIQATQYGISNNTVQFFVLLGMYTPFSGTFLTPNGELGIRFLEICIVKTANERLFL